MQVLGVSLISPWQFTLNLIRSHAFKIVVPGAVKLLVGKDRVDFDQIMSKTQLVPHLVAFS